MSGEEPMNVQDRLRQEPRGPLCDEAADQIDLLERQVRDIQVTAIAEATEVDRLNEQSIADEALMREALTVLSQCNLNGWMDAEYEEQMYSILSKLYARLEQTK